MIFNQASRYGNCVREMLVCQRPALNFAIANLYHVSTMTWIGIQYFISLFWCNSLMLTYALVYLVVVTFPWWKKHWVILLDPSIFNDICGSILYTFCTSLYLVIPALMCWICSLILASICGLERVRKIQQWKHRLQPLQARLCGQHFSKFSSQLGEIETKENRRAQYFKNQNAKVRERIKRTRGGRNKGQKKKFQKEVFEPQIGSVAVATALSKLANVRGISTNPKLFNKIEDLVAYFLAIKDCTTTSSFLATTFLYLKTHYHESVAKAAMTYVTEFLDATFDEQTGEIGVVVEKDKPQWLLLLKELQSNWTLVTRNEGFKKISHVLSLCMALGLCDAANLDFRIGGMKMFSIGALTKQATAIDLADAAFETVTYFVEGGYTCFERKSIKPLLYGNMENEEFEEAYAKCLRCHEYSRCGNLERYEKMSENDYEALLAKCIEKVNVLITSCRGPVEKNVLRRKLDMLRQWQATFRQTRVQGGLREAPYCIGIYGGSAVGKSTIANVLMVTTLLCNKYTATDDRIVTLNERDKYMSNFRSFTNGVLIDDIGNTKPEFVEQAPTNMMIQLVNNVRMYANMAEADMKGKVSVEPKVVIGTKNVKDTCATIYSNEPVSITRRERITLTCTVKPEYAVHDMLNEAKIRQHHPEGAPLIPDFWNITVEKSYPIPNKTEGKPAYIGWEVVKWKNGRLLENIGLPELIRWISQDSKEHFENQKQLVSNSSNLAGKIELCSLCNLPTPGVCRCGMDEWCPVPKLNERCISNYCPHCELWHPPDESDDEQDSVEGSAPNDNSNCCIPCDTEIEIDDETLDNQMGERLIAALLPKVRKWERRWRPGITCWSDEVEKRATEVLLKRLDWLETSRWVCWTNWVPKDWIEKNWMKNIVWATREEDLQMRIARSYRNHVLAVVIILLISCLYFYCFSLFLIFPLFGITGVVDFEKKRLYDKVAADNQAMPKVFKMYRDKHVQWITGACITIAGLYALAQIWKAIRIVPSPQGNLNPTTMVDIKKRDEEVNPWAGVQVSPIPCSKKSKTTTPDQLESKVFDNLCHMRIEVDDNGKKRHFECDAFFPKSNVALVPQHMWKADDIKANFVRHDPTKIGGNFECFLYRKNSVDIPDSDLSLVWVPNGGDWKDLTDYLPTIQFQDVPARLIYKKSDGDKVASKLKMECGMVDTFAASFFGAKYNLSFGTFQGLCMAPLITETKGPLIGGFHLGGKSGETLGCSGLLLKSDFDSAFEQLRSKNTVVLSKSSGTMPTKLYDIQFFENTDVHPKSPVNFLPEGTNCKFYGQVTGRATYHSEVEDTVISAYVEDVCGIPQKWGGPKLRKNWPWQASLQYSAKPSCGIEGSLLERAVDDYFGAVTKKLEQLPGLKVDVKPLTEMETVCGIDGLRFIDKMPPSTSVGFPLSGPKSNFLTLCDPDEYPTHQCPAILDQRFWDHAKEMEELYLRGERAYPIFKACLKDEPTKLTKDKVRVFQGAPLALQLLVRKYYLPIARILSMLPLASECAVGINAQGPEWDQLAKHIRRYGENRILAGDYSKYDLRMPAQVMFSAFKIMIEIGRLCGYSERDFQIMEGVATDICYPLMAYNGDLIQHYGSNPSGQNLTVYVNSIVNALLFRCAYYHTYKDRENVPEFQDICSLITYGDDAKSSVHEDYPEFNHITVAKFLEERDMKFTMPDKESEPVPYMADEEADLLKRSNIYSEDTGMIMGALDEDSIFKSLHAVLKSKAITREQQAMQNIDGALREWFPYGREHYEKRREQMKEVAKRADISHGCSVLHETYDDRLKVWKDKYG